MAFIHRVIAGRSEGPALLIEGLSLAVWDTKFDSWLNESPWIDDDDLLERVWMAGVDRMSSDGARWDVARDTVIALSHFAGRRAEERLRSLALGAEQSVADRAMREELERSACELLASRGDSEVLERVVAAELDRRAKESYVGWWVTDALMRYDRERVARQLRARIADSVEPVVRWVELLTQFAAEEDTALFARLEESEFLSIANVARSYLVERRSTPARGVE